MTGESDITTVAQRVMGSESIAPVGAGTQFEVGGVVSASTDRVHAPEGVIAYDPAELTVRVGAGTSVADLAVALHGHGQEVLLDPIDTSATVGGVLATGLSGIRRLGRGPVRDTLLEARFVTGDGRVVKAGGPTVKNVTGYDIPRLLVGSLGTLAVMVDVTLRCVPLPRRSHWFTVDDSPEVVRDALFRPSALLWNGESCWVLLEGHADDLDAQAASGGLRECGAPALPSGTHRGRISVDPARVASLADRLARDSLTWTAEIGVGTVHVASDTAGALGIARESAHADGGWMLREAGAPELDGWGVGFPSSELQARVRAAFDPDRRLSPGRVPW